MNESLLSEVDWGAHDSSVFLFLVNIDYDAKPNKSSIQGLWGELQHRTFYIPLIGLQTVSLASGQTGDDIFNSTQINPDLDDPQQLTGESIQSFLILTVQLQWLVALGRLVTHVQVTTLSKLKLTQKKLQRAYGYVLKITEFYRTQSKYYLHQTLIKHWDPFKLLKMATKITHDLWWHHLDLKTNIYGYIHIFQINGLSTTPHSSFHHLHTHTHTQTIYISTYYYACQHKNMLHPPQEGSNRSLAYSTLLGVLW